MDVENDSKHIFFARILRQTLEAIFSVRLLADKDLTKTQAAGEFQAISAFIVSAVAAIDGIGGFILEAALDSIGG